jgi:hypothetical protein
MNPLWKYFETARETAIYCCESCKNFKLLMYDGLAHTLSDIGASVYSLVLIGVFSGVFIIYWKVSTTATKKRLSNCTVHWMLPLFNQGYSPIGQALC